EAALYEGVGAGAAESGAAGAREPGRTGAEGCGDAEEWGQAALRFWSAMHARFDSTDQPAGLRRSFTDGVAGPGRGGLADWAQFIPAGITGGRLPGEADSAPAAYVPTP